VNTRILIVDDQPKNLQVLAFVLKNEGWKTIVAISGKQALSIAKLNPPDLILLDISMPEIDGFEVCTQLKQNPETQNIPIIFLSARTETEDIVKGFDLGGVDYVTKPFNPTELIRRVKTHLELKNAKKQIEIQNKILEEKNEELNELIKSKERIFSIIGHDLRGPIGGIRMALDFFEQSENTPILDLLKTSSEQSYNLLDNLLQWANSQRGELNPSFIHFNLKEVVQKAIFLLSGNAFKKNITLSNNIDEELVAFTDYEMFFTIIRNLISNSIKFSKINGNVDISAHILDNRIQMKVSDKGVGMLPEVRDSLFLSDIQISTYGTDKEKGSGLGLKVCKEFVEKCGGKIWVESEVEVGSNFFFTIKINE